MTTLLLTSLMAGGAPHRKIIITENGARARRVASPRARSLLLGMVIGHPSLTRVRRVVVIGQETAGGRAPNPRSPKLRGLNLHPRLIIPSLRGLNLRGPRLIVPSPLLIIPRKNDPVMIMMWSALLCIVVFPQEKWMKYSDSSCFVSLIKCFLSC